MPTQAASSDGVVAGVLLDPANGEYLRNASIVIETTDGGRRSTSSNDRGEYRIGGLPSGPAKITISYTGYAPHFASINIPAAGQTLQHNANLVRPGQDAATAGEQIVVTANFLEGDARAIMDQRQSMDIKNNLSTDSYGDIADGNPAEFMKFMAGVDVDGTDGSVANVQLRGLPAEYTGVSFDGIDLPQADVSTGAAGSQTFRFDAISLADIDTIEISKTTSADAEANSPAGTINIRSRRAFSRKGKRLTVSLSGATHADLWDSRKGTGPGEGGYGNKKLLPNASANFTGSFFDRRLGISAGISQTNTYIEREAIYNNRNYVPTQYSSDPMAVTSLEMETEARKTSRFSASFSADFRASDSLILSLSSNYYRGTIWKSTLNPQVITGVRRRGVIGEPVFDFTTQQPANAEALRVPHTATYKITTGKKFVPSFEYKRNSILLEGKAFYSESYGHYDLLDGKGQINRLENTVNATGNFSASRSSDLLAADWNVQQISGGDWSDPASFSMSGVPEIRTNNGATAKVTVKGGQSDFTWDTEVSALPIQFKTGFLLRESKYAYEDLSPLNFYRYIGPMSNAELLAAVQTSTQISSRDSGASITTLSGRDLYFPSPAKMADLFLSNPEHWENNITPTRWYNAYVANSRYFRERRAALYGMVTSDVTSRLKLRAGLRWEQTTNTSRERDPLSVQEVEAAGYAVSASTGRATTIPGLEYQFFSRPEVNRKRKYDYFFPSASAKFAFTKDTYLHAGYSRTIQRPPISVLAGVWSIDEIDQQIRAPNPGLEPAISDNFSVRMAHFFEPVSMIAVNFYMNKVSGLFQQQELTAEEFGNTDPRYENYTFISTTTVGEEAINIRGIEIEANHAMKYLPSPLDGLAVRASFMYNDPEIPIVRVADKVASVSLSYKKGPVQLFFNTLWNDDKYRSTTPSYFAQRWEASLSGSVDIARRASIFFSVRNLFNTPVNVILRGPADAAEFPPHSAIYVQNGRSGTFGVRARF